MGRGGKHREVQLHNIKLPRLLIKFNNMFGKGLGTVRILYSKISLVFHNGFSSNGRAGLMLLLSPYWPRIGLYSVTWLGG